ncbi:MAG: hypothetical protein ACP5SB_02825 [Caldisericaceae bacterium]
MEENLTSDKLTLWLHMHQPDYWDSVNNIQYLPWVRKHSTKAYYMIPKLISKSQAKININFSGILLEQLSAYASGSIEDVYEALENKDAKTLTQSEISFIVDRFLIPLPNESERFKYLRDKKMHGQNLSVDEIRDVQVLFKLLFFAPLDEEVIELNKKSAHFSENDKQVLSLVEKKIIQGIFPLYRQLANDKRVELTVTPYYHPILPLLIDVNSAKRSKSNAILPNIVFSHQDDALYNIQKSIEIFQKVFGFKPVGMWPAEGSISAEALDLIKASGFEFVGSDEMVLKKSFQGPQGAYTVRGLKVLFRDHINSDKIGFVYNKEHPQDAVNDLLAQKKSILILDGENPWDYYSDLGMEFLSTLFNNLNEDNCSFASEVSPSAPLQSIEPGSWINGYFDTWIGDEESNRAWTYLAEARDKFSQNAGAMEEVYKAESSDFFWWYSNFHRREVNHDFDFLFRNHLIRAYLNAGEKVPEYLLYPVKVKL